MKLSAPLLLFVFLIFPQIVFGWFQNPPQRNGQSQAVDEMQRRNRDAAEIENQTTQLKNPITNANYRRRQKAVLSEKDREAIKINADDAAAFTGFLKQSDTGIVRLHDVSLCSENMGILEVNAPCPQNVWGKATAFSFRAKGYRLKLFSDIQLNSKTFDITGINILGFLSNLGDISIETANLKTAGIKELAEFEPSTEYKEVVKQQKFARKGFIVGDFFYRSSMPVELSKTYVLRSIAYRSDFYFQIGKTKMSLEDLDKRKDVIVVFRLIRQYDDGSVGILWKKLKRNSAPVLEKK